MSVGFLKRFSVASISFLILSTVLSAADTVQLEEQMKQVRTETAMGNFGAKTAVARPEVDGKKWFVTADILYWHAKVGGTEFAYTDNDPIASLPIHGRVKDMDFEWDWGFRVGLGYNFEHDGWDCRAQYTYFDSNGSESTSAGLNSVVIPLRGSTGIVNGSKNGNKKPCSGSVIGTSGIFMFCQSAKSQYDFDYQAIDVELGRDFFVSEHLSIRPFAGLKTAWFDIEQQTRYNGGESYRHPKPYRHPKDDDFIDDFEEDLGLFNENVIIYGVGANTVHVDEECDNWGIGPRAGVDTRWDLGYGVSIFGNVAGALLFTYFDVDHREKYSEFTDSRIHLRANRHAFSPTVQFQLGLRYDTYVLDNKQHVGLGLGFEAQYWWRQNQLLRISDEVRLPIAASLLKYERYSEDVSMYGVTLDFKWDF